MSAGERLASCSSAEHPGGEHGSEHDLTLDPDVPQSGGEGDQHARRGEQQRHPGDQHVREVAHRARRRP